MSRVIEVVVVDEGGVTVSDVTLADDTELEWTHPITGEPCLFKFRPDLTQIWIEVGP